MSQKKEGAKGLLSKLSGLAAVSKSFSRRVGLLSVLLGLSIFSPQLLAQTVVLNWDASPSTNVIGYRVYYGTASGSYSSTTNVGSQLSATINGLQAGTKYFFAATALDSAGLESVPSAEISHQVSTTPVVLGLSFGATEGVITAPFVASNGTIYQTVQTGVESGGRASYDFMVSAAGDYMVTADVNARDDGANSFYVNIDGEPTDPYMIWNIPVTVGFENRTVSWNGGYGQYPPKIFTLTAGTHQLIVRGREGNTVLGRITIVPVNNVIPPPSIALTSPTSGTGYTAPATVNFAANVTANGNTINKVQFFNGATLLGEDATSPYDFSWNNVGAGNYALSARVVYNSTGSVTSASANIAVTNAPVAPTIALTSPANGATLTAPAEITVAASVTANGNTISKVQFFNGTTLLGEDTTAPYTFVWNNVSEGNYTLSARAIYGTSAVNSSSANVTVTAPPSTLPAPWQNADIGSVEIAGKASESSGVFTVGGAGSLAGSSDSFHFVYQPLSGDGEIIAKVRPVGTSGVNGAFGVIIRESLTTGSTYAYMGALKNGQFRWQQRSRTSGSASGKTIGKSTTSDLWVRLVRSGNTLTGYQSTNGKTWSQAGSVRITQAANISIGLVVASGSTTALETASFSNLIVVP